MPPVIASREGATGIIELARPEKHNALSREAFRAIGEALGAFEADRDVRALLIRAQGANFCTGADLDQVGSFGGDGSGAGENSRIGHEVLLRLEASRLPVVAAVQGLALAGGLELVLACDVAIAAASARFGDQHARFGLIPGWGGSQRLPRLIGLRRSLDLFFSARWIDAPTAESWGLVNLVVPDDALRQAALDYCAAMAARNPDGLSLMKRLAREGLGGTLADGLETEAALIPGFLESRNVQEGIAAFLERREPSFE